MGKLRYEITHDPELLQRYDDLAQRLFLDTQVGLPKGLAKRGALVGMAFPLLAFDGDQLVAGILPSIRHAENQHILLPEEEGTHSRLLGIDPLLSDRFVWSNHICVEPRYQGVGIFRELCFHLGAMALVFKCQSIGLVCAPAHGIMYKAICAKYAGLHGDVVNLPFVLNAEDSKNGLVIFLAAVPPDAPMQEETRQRLLDHCERYGIEIPT